MTQEAWEAWVNSNGTRWLIHKLNEDRLKTQERAGSGCLLNMESMEGTALNYTKFAGYCDGIETAINIITTRDGENSQSEGD